METYDALCLKEPYLELILRGVKTLETRTKCLRRRGGEVLLTSSCSFDQDAWVRLLYKMKLESTEEARRLKYPVNGALHHLGTLAGLVTFGDARPGVPGVDDEAACISIALPGGKVRWVWPITNVRRVERTPVIRLRPDGVTRAPGASQGFFKVPKDLVHPL